MSSSVPLILLALVCGVAGQLTLKAGMTQVGSIDGSALARPAQLALQVLTSPFVVGGLALYVVGAAAWLGVLSRVPLSFAYPLLASSYAITPVLAWMVLGESLPSVRWLGILAISVGVVLVSRS